MKSRSLALFSIIVLAAALPAFAAAPDGAAIFKTKCAPCHGADGSGQTTMGKKLNIKDLRSDDVQKQTDIELTKVISGGKGKMPPYGKQLSTADIQALIAFIRTLKPSS